MNILYSIMNKILIFGKEPQKIGLSQLREKREIKIKKTQKRKGDIKISDLMRGINL